MKQALGELVKKTLGPIVIVSEVYFVSKLRKTRSGKTMRSVIKSIITSKPLGDYSIMEDEASVDELRKAVANP